MSQATLRFGDQNAVKVMSTVWAALVLVLAAGITAVWIGVLGFVLMHLIEHAI
jgi:hypothetical protein